MLTEYAEGESYSHDVERLRNTGKLVELDRARADTLCDYLTEIHSVRGDDPGLYTRRIRELVGHGECIMGITDTCPQHPLIPASLLETIEHLCVKWRGRLEPFTHRLRQVHGDFHPWNILFRSETDFSVLDRSRGEYGDPADDVASLTMNYVFFSLQRSGRLEGALEFLFLRFWQRYIEKTRDSEMSNVVGPFLSFRGLVMASPVWYPALPDTVRQRILAFVVAVLETEHFDPTLVAALKAQLYWIERSTLRCSNPMSCAKSSLRMRDMTRKTERLSIARWCSSASSSRSMAIGDFRCHGEPAPLSRSGAPADSTFPGSVCGRPSGDLYFLGSERNLSTPCPAFNPPTSHPRNLS